MKWTNIEESLLTKYFHSGKTNIELGVIFKRKPDTISVKLKRMGLIRERKNNYWEIVKCKHCEKKFKSLISENRKFCSRSCSAISNNQKFPKRKKILRKCKNCKKNIPTRNKEFCTRSCRKDFKRKKYFKKIETNNLDNLKFHTIEKWIKIYLIYKYGEKCMKCGWKKVHSITKKVPIQLNHIDGNSDNNDLSNTELLCPNCHSLTSTYGALNMGKGRTKRKLSRNNHNKK